MTVNMDVDFYTKTQTHGKNIQNLPKNARNNLTENQKILYTKI